MTERKGRTGASARLHVQGTSWIDALLPQHWASTCGARACSANLAVAGQAASAHVMHAPS